MLIDPYIVPLICDLRKCICVMWCIMHGINSEHHGIKVNQLLLLQSPYHAMNILIFLLQIICCLLVLLKLSDLIFKWKQTDKVFFSDIRKMRNVLMPTKLTKPHYNSLSVKVRWSVPAHFELFIYSSTWLFGIVVVGLNVSSCAVSGFFFFLSTTVILFLKIILLETFYSDLPDLENSCFSRSSPIKIFQNYS